VTEIGTFFVTTAIYIRTPTQYISGQHDGSINIQIVYTATTQTDFMRIITKLFSPFYCKHDNFDTSKNLNIEFSKTKARTCMKTYVKYRNFKLYYQLLRLTYLCNLARY